MAAGSSALTEPAANTLVIERIFDAPRELVFKAWNEPKHLVRWLGPQGFTGTIIKMDARPGGGYRFHMRSPEGTEHWQQGVYRELVEPERLVSTYEWADAEGKPTRPETVLTVTFEDDHEKTKLTLHQAVFESVTARDLHNAGWTTTLDRLAEYLARA